MFNKQYHKFITDSFLGSLEYIIKTCYKNKKSAITRLFYPPPITFQRKKKVKIKLMQKDFINTLENL